MITIAGRFWIDMSLKFIEERENLSFDIYYHDQKNDNNDGTY